MWSKFSLYHFEMVKMERYKKGGVFNKKILVVKNIMYKIIAYIATKYQEVVDKTKNILNFSGLEQLAIVGLPNNFVGGGINQSYYDQPKKIVDGYFLSHNIKDYHIENGRVLVTRVGDNKTVALNPDNIQHDAEGYVSAKLSNGGMNVKTSDLKRLVKMLLSLKKK